MEQIGREERDWQVGSVAKLVGDGSHQECGTQQSSHLILDILRLFSV